jgi:hypothetical protein
MLWLLPRPLSIPSAVSKLALYCTQSSCVLPVELCRERRGYGGVGTKSYEKTWSSINHSILPGYLNSQPVSAVLCSTKLCVLQIKPNCILFAFVLLLNSHCTYCNAFMTVTKTTRNIVLFFTLWKKVERGGEDRGVTGLVSVSGHYNHAVSARTL